MRLRDPLHLGALFCGLSALFWGLSVFIGGAFALAFLLGLAAGIVLLFPRMPTAQGRKRLRAAAGSLLAIHGVFIALFIITTPVNLGEDPDQGLNLEPPEWAREAVNAYGNLFIMLAAVLLPMGIVAFTGRLEQILAGGGALAVIVVILLGWLGIGAETQATGTAFQMLAFLGFLAIAFACIRPPWQEEHPPWSASAPGDR